MTQTFTPSPGDGSTNNVQLDYPMAFIIGQAGQVADMMNLRVISGQNETTSMIPYGIPVILNSAGQLPNSVAPSVGTGIVLGITARSEVYEKHGPDAVTPYASGIPPLAAANVMVQGAIYIQCTEPVAPGDTLRYFKSGANAGKWGKTASAGNSIALDPGNWVIRRAGNATDPAVLEVNAPASLAFTAD